MHQAALPHALLDVPVVVALLDSARRVVREHFESNFGICLGSAIKDEGEETLPEADNKSYKKKCLLKHMHTHICVYVYIYII